MENQNTPQGGMPQMRKPVAQPARPITGQPLVGQPVVRPTMRPVASNAQTAGVGMSGASASGGIMNAGTARAGGASVNTSGMRANTGAAGANAGVTGANASVAGAAGAANGATMSGAMAGASATGLGVGVTGVGASAVAGQPGLATEQTANAATKDEKKKKKGLLIGGIIVIVLLVGGIAAAILIPMLTRVDYAESYSVATKLKTEVENMYKAPDCDDVGEYVDIAMVSDEVFGGYIDGCLATFQNDSGSLVGQLGQTDGVAKNEEINTQFAKFRAAYNNVMDVAVVGLDEKLALYQAWHEFIVAVDSLTYAESSDEQFTAAAQILIDTKNEAFVAYGQGWLTLSIDVANAYRNGGDYDGALATLVAWIELNRPDLTKEAPLDFSATGEMYTEFNKLYSLINDNK